jgi:putative ABC transport system permease protein
VLLVGIAMLLALAMVELTTPLLSAYLDLDLDFRYFGQGGFLLPALGLMIVVGLIGGLYPALYLSRFQPAQVLKANKSSADPQGSGRFRSALVVTQFAISIGLIICTAIVYTQTQYVQTVDLGFEREGLIQIDGAGRLESEASYQAMKREISAVPGVVAAARTNMAVASQNKTIQSVLVPGQSEPIGNGFYWTDPDYLGTMGMRLLAGRGLSDRFANDHNVSGEDAASALAARGLNVVINRNAAMQWGFGSPQAAVGKQVKVSVGGSNEMVPTTVVGVVEDTRFRSARTEVEPLIFGFDPEKTGQIVVRYRSANPAETMAGLQRVWARFFPEFPFEGAFAEDLVAELYEGDRRRGMTFAAFAILAVVIACLGLFGLASFTTERRTKEIGIRKVLGAKVRDIVQLLTWQFSKPVVIANLVAWPAAWWVMRDWLNTFDLRIDLGPAPFLLAGLIALAIAIATVAGHAIKVARLNPVHAIRYE